MAKRVFDFRVYTPAASADGATLASSTYQAITNGGPTAQTLIYEIYEGGQATSSAVNGMVFARHSVVATSPTALAAGSVATDGFMPSNATTLSASCVTFVAATTGAIRSTTVTQARLNLSFNSFGGIVRWVAAPGEEWGILGTGANVESSLHCVTGTPGLMGSHLVYETF